MPEVNPAETTPDVIPTKPSDEFLRDAEIAKAMLKARMEVRQEYEELFKIWKNNELVELEKKQNEIVTKGLEDYYTKWKAEQKPPEPEDIQQLLDQEYITYTLPVDVINEDNTTSRVMFTIREIPQLIEKTFYRSFKQNLLNKVAELEALTQSELDVPFEKKVKAGLELLDESFDVMAEAVVLILNPFGNKKEIDKAWVQKNICSDRQWRIIEAQMHVNRLRDFFSRVSLSTQNMMTTRGPNFPLLRQHVA